MVRTALLTLGRMPKGLDMARALHQAGWRVVVADPFRRHLCRSSRAVDRSVQVTAPRDDAGRFIADLEAIIAAEAVSLVVPVSEEAMYAAALAERLPAGVRFFGPDLPAIRALHDKAAFIATAARFGLAVPETHRLGTADAAMLAARTDIVIKPVFSSAGAGLVLPGPGEPLPTVHPGEPARLVQARLPGRHRSSVSVAHAGRVLGHVFYEATVLSHTVAVAFRRIEAPDLDAWASRFIAATGHTGFIAFDFIDDANGIAHAIECNPRANSGVHFFDRAGLGRALAEPGTAPAIGYRPERLMQQFFPCLTETQASVFRPARFRSNWRYLTTSRDVTWDRTDPWPLIMLVPNSATILRRAIFRGESFGAAATADIAYAGEGD